jgi:hypothetical protein
MCVGFGLRPLVVRTNACRWRRRQFKHYATCSRARTQAKLDASDHTFDSKFNIQNTWLTGDPAGSAALRAKSAALTVDLFVFTKQPLWQL